MTNTAHDRYARFGRLQRALEAAMLARGAMTRAFDELQRAYDNAPVAANVDETETLQDARAVILTRPR